MFGIWQGSCPTCSENPSSFFLAGVPGGGPLINHGEAAVVEVVRRGYASNRPNSQSFLVAL